jgi:hypothetical protein
MHLIRKYGYIKVFFFILIFLSSSELFSQVGVGKDTMAFIKIYNSQLLDPQTLQFDLYLERKSEKWVRFANGTFSLSFDDTVNFKFNRNNLSIHQYRTELRQDIVTGNLIPTYGYRTDFQIYDNRLSITVLGPEKFEDCEFVSIDNPLLLGSFIVSTTNESFPDYIMTWMKPYTHYQAAAFKMRQDSLINNEIIWYQSGDNVSMEDSISITYVFINDTTRKYFELDFFRADYVGKMDVKLSWNTIQEYGILGYTVSRAMILPGFDSLMNEEEIISWHQGETYNSELEVPYNNPNRKFYGYYDDELDYRLGSYVYSLYGTFYEDGGEMVERLLDTALVRAPQAIVSSAWADPHVFSSETTITYVVDDDVYLTAFLTDLLGKELKTLEVPEWGLLENKEVKRGQHTFVFKAPDLASQGFYNIRFVAYPIDDPTQDVSTVDVKLQLIK